MFGIIGALIGPLLGKVIDIVGEKVGVDMKSEEIKGKKLELEAELQKLVFEQDKLVLAANLEQVKVNAEEAKNDNIFVSGWRPFIGWVCGASLTYHFILQPLIIFIATLYGLSPVLPAFDASTLSTILMGMLGLGAMRSYEKRQGVAGRPSIYRDRLDTSFNYTKDANGTIIARKID